MHIQHILKKASLLLIGYIFFIFGIFIIQFRNGSTITERFGNMRVSLATQTLQNNNIVLQNNMTVSFMGISFFANSDAPIFATDTESNENIPLELLDWATVDKSSCRFDFTKNVHLLFSLDSVSDSTRLDIHADFPDNISSLSLPYSITSGYTSEKQGNSSVMISNRNTNWAFSASSIDDKQFLLYPYQATATYRFTTQSELFTFADIGETVMASADVYESSIEAFKAALISSYQNVFRNSTHVSEHEVVAFVSAMAEAGKYNEAMEAVPQYFKTGNERTYFSSPYFNSLVMANRTLTNRLAQLANLINESVSESYLKILETEDISNYVIINKNSQNVATFVENIAKHVEENSVQDKFVLSDAINVIRFYNTLLRHRIHLAAKLESAAMTAAKKIESLSLMEGDTLVISDGGALLSALETAKTGDALVHYGKQSGNVAYMRAGHLILNSLFANISSFDSKTLAAFYPIVVHENSWYPHVAVLDENGDSSIWAWTCGKDIKYTRTPNAVRIELDFAAYQTHHLILRGIENFDRIDIYETQYRSDPRFEAYNASGYTYQADTKSLLLKSRHRTQTESIVLHYNLRRAAAEDTVQIDTE